MLSDHEFYRENLIRDRNDDEKHLEPFRIFKNKDPNQDPLVVIGSEAWINSVKTFPRSYEIIRSLYDSEFIKVKLCKNKLTESLNAIKFIKLVNLENSDQKLKIRHDRIEREISFLKDLNHLYIIKVKEIIRMVDCAAIVMEYAKNGELFEYVQRHKRIQELEAKKIMFQIFLAVDYLHSNGIVHRDLKLENILMDANGQIKIADFGFANFGDRGNLKTSCGSPCYAAPEIVLKDKGYEGFPVDIWSCGVILFAMLFGHLPFEDQALRNHRKFPNNSSSINVFQLYQYISKHNLDIPKHAAVSPEAIDLVKGMLRSDPTKRMKLSEIFRHSWFANTQLL